MNALDSTIKLRGVAVTVTPTFSHPECTGCRHLVAVEIAFVGEAPQTLTGLAAEAFWHLYRDEFYPAASRIFEDELSPAEPRR